MKDKIIRLLDSKGTSVTQERISPKLNILITGATGFIGRHLTAALSKTLCEMPGKNEQ